ncbi:hypothetical protein BC937DRAFT_94411 [Endogone sp. FLAS-F59071]|nr:hypothetical protein BC937DRAFT_94411 [Endogone sp. FLAS-F59071]|eukprot:RUS14060.1 hypothetical protein BC937DRAFT_94411 [Endogone sp. FLAS-F59071]
MVSSLRYKSKRKIKGKIITNKDGPTPNESQTIPRQSQSKKKLLLTTYTSYQSAEHTLKRRSALAIPCFPGSAHDTRTRTRAHAAAVPVTPSRVVTPATVPAPVPAPVPASVPASVPAPVPATILTLVAVVVFAHATSPRILWTILLGRRGGWGGHVGITTDLWSGRGWKGVGRGIRAGKGGGLAGGTSRLGIGGRSRNGGWGLRGGVLGVSGGISGVITGDLTGRISGVISGDRVSGGVSAINVWEILGICAGGIPGVIIIPAVIIGFSAVTVVSAVAGGIPSVTIG